MSRKKIFAVSLSLMMAISLTLSYTASVYAEDKQATLDEVKEKQKAAEAEKQEVMTELNDYTEKIVALNTEITNKQTEIDNKQAEIDALVGKIEEMHASINDRKNGLSKRLRTMYKNGSIGFIDIILDSNNFSEFLSNISLLQEIYRSDQDTLNSLEKTSEELNKNKSALDLAKQDITNSQSVLKTKKDELAKVSKELEDKAAEIESTIAIFKQQADSLSSQILAEQQAAQNNYPAPSPDNGSTGGGGVISGATGNLRWPVAKIITSPFGYRVGLEQYGTFHTGTDLGVPAGTPVRASDSGRVMNLTGWYEQGYGFGVFLDHGNGVVTVYGHNSAILVSPGQYVQQGDVIALAGQTGWATGPHVHFEVRINGEYVNPELYVN
ncbi:MAG: peptidoglycan DD-metalloendopeptidase family protein [Eubacterium sp.]|nr:peptidoglycan DD-metalloendopeptidase family protein [Eubacterium sp.]